MKKTKTVLGGLLLFVGSFLCFMMASASVSAATSIGLNISTDGDLTVGGALKFTNGAVNNYILKTDALGNASWSSLSNVLSIASTDDLAEGLTNLYYSDARVGSYIDTLRGGANGLAELDGFGFVPMANLPVGVPDGVASLDATGKIYSSQIPAIAINETYTVADLAERDLLTPNKGDVSIVIDTGSGESRSYIWDGVSWIELLTPLELYLSKANNLGDLANMAVARSNLGLGVASTPTFNNLALSGLTTGSILFAGVGGFVSQDNANFYWDDANNRLGLKTSTPAYTLDVAGDIKVGDTYRLFLGQKTGGDPVGVNGAMYYNDSLAKFRCYENGGWKDCDTSIASLALSSLNSATSARSFNNGDYKQQWDWSLTSAGNLGMEFGEVIPSVATGKSAILSASTLVGSTVMPLYVKNLGDGFSFRVDDEANDTTSFVIDHTGRVGIGTDFFDSIAPESLKVEAPAGSSSYNSISAYGDVDNYLQINIKNRNAGGSASSDIVATADNGNEDDFYINMGINSSGYDVSTFSITGPNDGYLYVAGGNLVIGTANVGKDIIFHTSGTADIDEKMRITSTGEVGIGTLVPGAKLDVKGDFRLSGSTSGYFGLAVAADAGNVTYTLPIADGSAGQSLITDGFGILSWGSAATDWQRVGTILSPVAIGDDVTTSGDIYTSGTGTITSAGLLTSNAGLTVSGAAINLNNNSNFNTNINTGTSTGIVTIGNSVAGAINIVSGSSINLTAANSVFSSDGVNFVLQASGPATTANVQIGAGGLGSDTPDLLVLDIKTSAIDPISGTAGAMYYNNNLAKFRCYENSAWKDCDTTGGTTTLNTAYNNGGTITTAAGVPINFLLANGDFQASGAGSVNLTPTGASSFTSAGSLTLTGGAASTWSTSSGALSISSATASTWGTASGDLTLQVAGAGTTGSIRIGAGGIGSATPDLFALDVKSTAGDPTGYSGAMYYNAVSDTFRCHVGGGWHDCATAGGVTAGTLQDVYTNGPTLTTTSNVDLNFILTAGNFTTSGAGSVNLTPTGASSFTSGGALTLTGGASSTWSTSAGNLTLDSAATLNLGTSTATGVSIGKTGISTTVLGTLQSGNATNAGLLKLGDGTNNYISLQSPAIASDYTLTLPADNGLSGRGLITDGNGVLSWELLAVDPMTTRGDLIYRNATNVTARLGLGTLGQVLRSDGLDAVWQTLTKTDVGLSNVTNDAQIPKSIGLAKGDIIAYTASGTPVRLPLGGTNGQVLTINTAQATGIQWSSVATNANSLDFSEFKDAMTLDASTSIQLTGFGLSIIDSGAGALSFATGGALTLSGGGSSSLSTSSGALSITSATASTWGTSSGNLSLQVAGALTTANVQIGSGVGSDTPDLLVLDNKNTVGDPIIGTNGAMYYNSNLNKLRCFENSAWKDCDTSSASTSWQKVGTNISPGTAGDDLLLNSGETLTIGGGAVISRHLSNTAVLDFPNVGSRTCSDLTIIVTGAAVGDTVVASPDNSGGVEAVVLTWNAYVSAANTVTVRVCNPTTGVINPTSNTWRADVWQH